MTLSSEMRQLSQQFVAAYDARKAMVLGIRTDTAQDLGQLRAAHQAMAAELRARLDEQETARLGQAAEDARGRMGYVDNLRQTTGTLLQEMDAKLSEARQVWSSSIALMQQRRAGRRAVPPPPVAPRALPLTPAPAKKVMMPPPPAKEVMAPPRAAKEVAPPPPPPVETVVAPPPPAEEAIGQDNLTAIRGIGPVMQYRLNEAGIRTYVQLAKSTPPELHEMLGVPAQLVKVDDWIAQAQELAKQG